MTDILLLLRSDGLLLPVHREALGAAEGWPWTIRRHYANAIIISPQSTKILRVTRVDVLAPYGSSWPSKLFSVLNSNWRIALQTVEDSISLEEIIKLVSSALQTNETTKTLFDSPAADLTARIQAAQSMHEIFEALGIGDHAADGAALDTL